MDDDSRAMALASYEDGGLEKVFRAMLTAPHWNDPLCKHLSISSANTSGSTAIPNRATGHFAGI